MPLINKENYELIEESTGIDLTCKQHYILDVVTRPAPRMVNSDRFKTDLNHPDPKKRKRLVVDKYFQNRQDIQWLARMEGYKPQPVMNAIFILPMPETWPDEKKKEMYLKPHQGRPDRDNLIKSIQDALCKEDGFIWDGRITKLWGIKGLTILY